MAEFWKLDDRERALWTERWRDRTKTRLRACPDCGGDPDVCGSPETDWYPYRHVCYAQMLTERWQAQYRKQHEERPYHDGQFKSFSATRGKQHPYHFEAGVRVSASMTEPDVEFLREPSESDEPAWLDDTPPDTPEEV